LENNSPDCIVIGYNETPFAEYEQLIRKYGEDSETYQDLRFSFVDTEHGKLNYIDLFNHVVGRGSESERFREFKSGDIPSLASCYLINYLGRHGFSGANINLFQYEKEQLATYLAGNPLAVAITTTFYVLNEPVIEMVRFIREQNPTVKIIVGGPLIANHHNRFPAEMFLFTLGEIGADIYVVESQGEQALGQVLTALRDGGDLAQVPNIVYYDGDQPKQTACLPENNDLDQNYLDWGHFSGVPLGATLQARTARSCAFKCAFCAYPMRAGALTLASLETIEKELDSAVAAGAKNLVFIDDTFNVPLPRFKDICRLMIRKKYNLNWFSYFRCSNADELAIDLMAEAGCKGVFLGIESGSPTILKGMNKAAKIDQYRKGIQRLRANGIVTFGSFITGFPGETQETIRETIDFIRETEVDYYRMQMWYCEPGTPIYNEREKYKIKGEAFNWEHATMDSKEAMASIEAAFLEITESQWLPQWSFDFWILPYFLGRGLDLDLFKELMEGANALLRLEIAGVELEEKQDTQELILALMEEQVKAWDMDLMKQVIA